ncbi:MAG: hypothetical protein PHI12_09765 [Dehalococcoidales bacterium]|nr:hypothetical protein [Dehalococcoidales bacterium]
MDFKGRLSEITGIKKSEVDAIYADVKANMAALDACEKPHDFKDIEEENTVLPRRAKCTKCGGTVSVPHARWYKRGLEDGSKK